MIPVLRVGGVAHAHGDVRAGILLRVGRRREQLSGVKARVARIVDDLLALCILVVDDDRRNGVSDRFSQMESERSRVRVQKKPHALSAAHQADDHSCAVESPDVIEDHGGPFLGRPHHGSSRAHMAVNTRYFRMGVHLDIRFDILSGNALQQFQRRTQIADFIFF